MTRAATKAAIEREREAGKTDPARLERYLRTNCRVIPRTTFRYAIERFDVRTRKTLMALD